MKALGFPPGLYKKLFIDVNTLEKAKAKTEPLLYATPLYMEIMIARDLHMTLEEFQKLPRKERRAQYLYNVLATEKERYQVEKANKEAEIKSNAANTPAIR